MFAFIPCFSGCGLSGERMALSENRASASETGNERFQSRFRHRNMNLAIAKQKNIDAQNRSAETQADIAEIKNRIEWLTGRLDEFKRDLEKNPVEQKAIDALDKSEGIRFDVAEIKNRIEWLTGRLDEFKRDLEKNPVEQKAIDALNKSAGIRVDIAENKNKIKWLTGRLDEIKHNFENKIEEFKTSVESVNNLFSDFSRRITLHNDWLNRLQELADLESKKFGSSPKREFVSKTEGASQTSLPAKHETATGSLISPKNFYEFAKKALDKKDFETAKKGFRDFLKRNPGSPLAGNSQFWIGEIYYMEKKYEKAIVEYQDVIEKYPDCGKTPAALLKQGLSFAAISDKKSSVLFLNELISRFPGSKEAEIAVEKLRKLR